MIFKFAVFRQHSEVVASLKSDKDALETTLYEAQQLNAQLETRKEQLEGENQELILKKENLMGKAITFPIYSSILRLKILNYTSVNVL